MKKALIIAILAALVLVPVAAIEFTGIGITAGYNFMTADSSRLTGTFNFDAKNEGYIQVGYKVMMGCIEAGVGYDYVIDAFKVEGEKINIKVGGQAGALVMLGSSVQFAFSANATAALSYNFKIEKAKFNTFFRLGAGAFLHFDTEGLGVSPSILADLGLVYKF